MSEFTASQKRKYLARVLRMNPLVESEKIIEFRATLLGIAKPKDVVNDAAELQKSRAIATQKIEELRKRFWVTPQISLIEELKQIEVGQLPDLQPTVSRLLTIAELIPLFQKLAQHPDTRINLVNTIKRLIMLPPKEAGAIKAAYLRKAAYASALPIVKKMVHMMYREFPDIYNLEPDWFFEISKLAPRIP